MAKIKEKKGLMLKKALGQHLLTNQDILSKIAHLAHSYQVAFEIGPGTGNLTEYILQNESLQHLILIEKDPDMIEILKNRFNDNRIIILNQDATKLNIAEVLKSQNINHDKICIIGNFPYNVGNSIIINLVEQINNIGHIIAMLQKEVVERFCAKPKTKDYGKISILCQMFCKAEKLYDISPNNFTPPPKVMSSILKLTPIENEITTELYKKVNRICTIGFNNRRKKFITLLKNNFSTEQVEKMLTKIHNHNTRIEELAVSEIIEIANQI